MKKCILIYSLIIISILSLSITGYSKGFQIGGETGFGISYSTISEPEVIANMIEEHELRLGFCFGLDGYYYFNKNIGIHLNFGYNVIQGKYWVTLPSPGKFMYTQFQTFNIDIGPAFLFNGVFIDLDVSFNFKLDYKYKSDSPNWEEFRNTANTHVKDFVFALGLSAGYKFKVNNVSIPVGLSFKYYITTFVDKFSGEDGMKMPAWTLLFTVGILING